MCQVFQLIGIGMHAHAHICEYGNTVKSVTYQAGKKGLLAGLLKWDSRTTTSIFESILHRVFKCILFYSSIVFRIKEPVNLHQVFY